MKYLIPLLLICSSLFFTACKSNTSKENGKNNNTTNETEEADEEAPGGWLKQNFEMTKDPALGYVPYERLAVAQAYTQSLINSRTVNTNSLAWTERGPSNVGGRTRAILIDKRDATGNTVFAGSVGGGIWKCTNFKSTSYSWSAVNNQLPNLSITALAQDPTIPTTMYAGTGEGWFNTDAIRGNGIYKSVDGGITWTLLSSTDAITDFQLVQDIVVTSTGIVFAACRSASFCNRGGVLKSLDGGVNWTRVIGTYDNSGSCNGAVNFRAADLEIAANGDIYAATGMMSDATTNKGKVFKSEVSNGDSIGNTSRWVDVTPPAISTSTNWRRIELAPAPNNANILYALCEKTGGTGAIGALFRSDDKGTTWIQLANPSRCSQGATSSDFTNGQCWYDLSASVDPNNSSTCVVGGVDAFKTINSGTSWSQISQWASGCGTPALPYIHSDIHNIIYPSSSSSEIIATSDGGVFYSTDGGVTWSDKNNNYNVTQFYACAIHPTNTNYFLAGAQDNGSHKFSATGLNATTKASGGDGAYCHIDQTDGQIQVTSYVYNNYYYTRDGGATSFKTVPGGTSTTGQFINPTEYDDALDVLYTSAAGGTYGLVSGLAGTGNPSYQAVSVSDLLGKTVTAFKVDPNVPSGGTVWMVGSNSGSPVFVKLSNTNTNAPVTVTAITASGFTSGSWVSSIDVENGNPNHLLATVSNYGANSVMESTDGGTTWTNIEGANFPDMPVRWGIFAPANALLTSAATGGGIILATETGVWCTSTLNGTATTWAPQNTGMANVSSYMLKYRSSDRTLAVATHGRGLFTTVLPSVVTAINPTVNTKGFITSIAANAANLYIKAGNLTGIKNMQINVYDMQGRQLLGNNFSYNNQTIPLRQMPSGAYVVKVLGDKKEQYTQQFVK